MAKKRREVQLEKKAAGKRGKGKTSKRKHAARASIITLVILLLLIASGAYIFYTKLVIPTRESKDPLSILLVGSDVSSYRDEHYGGTKPEKTDSLIVLTFNPNTYTVDLSSIPRDTSVDYVCDSIQDFYGNMYTGVQYQDQVNELYQVSGKNMDCLTESVSNFLNIPINYYVKVNMDQLAEIIDAVGGVEIEVYAPDYYLSQVNTDLSETYYWTSGEVVTMDGDEALTYARARHDSEKDYGRGLRQQQVLSAIVNKVLNGSINVDLVKSLYSLVETDMPYKLIYEYYKYVMALTSVLDMIAGNGEVKVDDMPDTVWLNLYDLTGFEGTLTGTPKQRQKEVEEFIVYLQSDAVDAEELKGQIITNHQLYNSAYSGHYNAEYDQLYQVSNSLRENLGLEDEDIALPSYQYGDNYAYGLMPDETVVY